jgi:hypothetical protein
MTKKTAKPLSIPQRLVVSLLLMTILTFWIYSNKFWYASIVFMVLVLTVFGFSRNAFLNYLSSIFSSIIARIAYYVSRFIIQVMYLLLIFPINSIINKKIMRDYNILQTKIRPNNLNSGNMIDFESYF